MYRIPRPFHGGVLSSSLYGDHVKASRAKWKQEAFVPGVEIQYCPVRIRPSFSLVHLVWIAVSAVAQLEEGILHSGPQRLNCFRRGFLPAVVLRELLDPEDCNFINGLKSTAG